MGQSSAKPSVLRTYATAVGAMDQTIAPPLGTLRPALDDFRSSKGWGDWLDDVPPLDVDVGAVRGRLDQLGAFVDEVATGFEAADPDPKSDTAFTIDDTALDPYVTTRLGETVELVRDGNRWIFPGTDGEDFVRVVIRDGRTFLEVGVVVVGADGRRSIRWEPRELTAEQAANLVIRTGGNNDWVAISPDVRVGVTVWTGDGTDVVGSPGRHYSSRLGGSGDDRIFTGEGDDRIEGGAGNDQLYGGGGGDYIDGQDGHDVIGAGDGEDVVYGGRGDDRIEGGDGNDYLEGGSGRDDVRGGEGEDILSGGRDDDTLDGGAGNDNLYGGRGVDTVTGGDGDDKVTAETQDRGGDLAEHWVHIELTGDPGAYAISTARPDWMTDAEWEAWKERLDSDVEFLRTTPSGRRSLEALDDASRNSDNAANPFDDDRHVRIVPYAPMGGGFLGLGQSPQVVSFDEYLDAYINRESLPHEDGDPPVDDLTRFDRSYASPQGNVVSYGQANVVPGGHRYPVLTLQHELSHAWDQLHDGWVDIGGRTYTETRHRPDGSTEDKVAPRNELNSVGLDLDGDGDIDTVGAGDGTDHPTYFTENALRDDLRMRRRTSYEHGTFVGDDRITYGDTDD